MTPTESTQQAFDAAYWASQPPEVQALETMDAADRATQAAALATAGYIIDVPIMVWGWDPYLVMTEREQFGYTWVPSALQPPIAIAPGMSEQGVTPYNPNQPPPGSIHVSTNIADYPPYQAPAVPAPVSPTITDPVGIQTSGNIYAPVAGYVPVAGAKVTDSRGTFTMVINVTPFGQVAYWLKVA